jgi:thiamine biosynthesis lipoprotein
MLDTTISIQAFGPNATEAIEKAFNRIADIEKKMTAKAETSEIIEINERAGQGFYTVSPETFFVIKKSLQYAEASNGKFDITVGPLVELWGIGTNEARVPSTSEINETLPLVDYRQVEVNEDQNGVFLKKHGMSIDLGGIAKGYAADKVIETLKQNGIKSGTADLGGNIFVLGTKPNGKPWKIGLQNPFDTRGNIFATVEVTDKTLVTSGPYERYFEKNWKRYHHILDTDSGFPVENGLMGVTIISDSSIDADALSTAVFTLGLEDGMSFVEGQKNIDAIFITRNYEVYISSGINKFNFKIVNRQFHVKNNLE